LFFVEHMDAKRLAVNPAYCEAMDRALAYKYGDKPPDLIYATDDIALDWTCGPGHRLWPGAHIVASGINRFDDDTFKHPHALAVGEEQGGDDTVSLALRLHPRVRRVVLICDPTAVGDDIARTALEQARGITTLPVERIGQSTLAELVEQV